MAIGLLSEPVVWGCECLRLPRPGRLGLGRQSGSVVGYARLMQKNVEKAGAEHAGPEGSEMGGTGAFGLSAQWFGIGGRVPERVREECSHARSAFLVRCRWRCLCERSSREVATGLELGVPFCCLGTEARAL